MARRQRKNSFRRRHGKKARRTFRNKRLLLGTLGVGAGIGAGVGVYSGIKTKKNIRKNLSPQRKEYNNDAFISSVYQIAYTPVYKAFAELKDIYKHFGVPFREPYVCIHIKYLITGKAYTHGGKAFRERIKKWHSKIREEAVCPDVINSFYNILANMISRESYLKKKKHELDAAYAAASKEALNEGLFWGGLSAAGIYAAVVLYYLGQKTKETISRRIREKRLENRKKKDEKKPSVPREPTPAVQSAPVHGPEPQKTPANTVPQKTKRPKRKKRSTADIVSELIRDSFPQDECRIILDWISTLPEDVSRSIQPGSRGIAMLKPIIKTHYDELEENGVSQENLDIFLNGRKSTRSGTQKAVKPEEEPEDLGIKDPKIAKSVRILLDAKRNKLRGITTSKLRRYLVNAGFAVGSAGSGGHLPLYHEGDLVRNEDGRPIVIQSGTGDSSHGMSAGVLAGSIDYLKRKAEESNRES